MEGGVSALRCMCVGKGMEAAEHVWIFLLESSFISGNISDLWAVENVAAKNALLHPCMHLQLFPLSVFTFI